ncbi:hypothetical protein ACLOJK_009255 [Asimina triloba]
MSELQHPTIKTEPPAANENSMNDTTSMKLFSSKFFVADLNARPPECDGGDCALAATPRSARGPLDQGLCHTRFKSECPLESGPDTEADQQCQGVSTSCEDKVTSLKAGLVRVARKMPKNAHAHFILGLMYQRLGQFHKAIGAFERASEILLQSEDGITRPELLSFVQIHHAQCILLGNSADSSDKELESEELDDILRKLRDSVQSDVRQATVWNTLGLILLRTGRLQSAISVLSSLLALAPDHLDALANLGLAYLQCIETYSVHILKAFSQLIPYLESQGDLSNHTAIERLISHLNLLHFVAPKNKVSDFSQRQVEAFLIFGGGDSIFPKWTGYRAGLSHLLEIRVPVLHEELLGPGADADEGSYTSRIVAANVAKECLAAAAKADPKSGYIWVNLANACHLAGDHKNAGKCLEKAARLEPNRMSTRYAVALYRTKEAERSQNPAEQLNWAANEMASILREGDPSIVEPRTAWAGVAIAHRAQHEIASAFDDGQKDLKEVEERAVCTLKKRPYPFLDVKITLSPEQAVLREKQAIEENPDDSVQWNQLGLYSLCTLQFKASQKYLKAAVACSNNSCYSWSNLGISLQLSEDKLMAEKVYKRALSLATDQEAHAILSNLGNLYRQQRQFDQAKAMFAKSFEMCPGYAPAHNNLGLVFAAEGRWEDAKNCFAKALQVDPLLDAAKSNMMKAVAMSRKLSSCTITAATSMATTIATMAMLNVKCMSISSPNHVNPSKPAIKPISLLSLQSLPKGLIHPKSSQDISNASTLVGTAIAGAIFSSLSCCDSAFAAQQIAEIAASDNRGLALLLPIIPAIAWVLFNILQPALNQFNRMKSEKGIIVGIGLGGLAASGFVSTPSASASEIAAIADASSNDSRGLLLLFVIIPAVLWVLYNILQPALNQINRMRSG